MSEVVEISLKEYSEKPSTERRWIDAIIQNAMASNPKLRIKGKEIEPVVSTLWDLTWEKKLDIEHYIKKGNLEKVMELIYGISDKQFISLNVFNCFACFKWVQDQLKQIAEVEQIQLSRDPSGEEMDAGLEEMIKFGHLPALESICEAFNVKEEEVMQWQYAKVFMRLCYLKTKADIRQNLMNNAKRNAKGNRR